MKIALLICFGLLVLANTATVYGQDTTDDLTSTTGTIDDGTSTTLDDVTSTDSDVTTDVTNTDSDGTTDSDKTTSSNAVSDSSTITTPSEKECQSETEMWSGADLRKFYFCAGGDVISNQCDEDYYYVNNATVSGCIPAREMNPSCVNLDATVPVCQGNNLKQPQVSQSLTNFYLCTGENAVAAELSCAEGKAFVNQDGYLGCFDWAEWRKLRDCPQ